MTKFIKGLDLCESFFHEIAQPIINKNFPSIRYSAGVIGYGSDTIGFDDHISTDHMWGPRFLLFLPAKNFNSWKKKITSACAENLPYAYKGYSVNFSLPDANDSGIRRQEPIYHGQVNPLIEFHTIRSYFKDYLGYVPFKDISLSQWLTFSEHRLLGITSGRIFHDNLRLNEIRQKLNYFPHDIRLWMMAAQWTMLAEEEAFIGRCGYVKDELGSQIIAARQVQRIMRLCFLMEKQYAPYSKWFGTAFKQLDIAPLLLPVLEQILSASQWKKREEYFCSAYNLVAVKHNSLGLTEEINSDIKDYYGRPFQVLFAERFSEAIKKYIHDNKLKQLSPVIGSVSQFTDSTTIFDNANNYEKFKNLYK